MDIFKNQIDHIIENGYFDFIRDRIVLGLSGGPDSVFTLLILDSLRKLHGLEFEAVHVNYNLRGDQSLKDREFCADLCRKHMVPLEIHDVHIEDNSSIQEKARNIRFDFFRKFLKRKKFSRIALGHNLDDNIETVFHNIIRGCGLNGLKGLDVLSKDIVRPVLNISKRDITDYLDRNSVEYRKDLSNNKNCYTRNIIRNRIISEILEINPSFHSVFSVFSENMKNYNDFVRLRAVDDIENNLISYDQGEFLRVNLELFEDERFSHIYINVILREYLYIEEGIYSSNIREIEKIINSGGGRFTVIKDFMVINDYRNIIFMKENCFDSYFPDFEENKFFPGKHIANVRFSDKTGKNGNNEYMFNSNQIKWPIVLRHRKNGDRIGTDTLLKKRFIDKKINRLIRDRVPVFEDSNGSIIWIPGIYRKKFDECDLKIIYTGRMFWIKTEN